ncbi:hypothetical protein OPT61_g10172 [Boeremia exigua]|uniref:Uncharacterized protein n=1 Tax=Boeremia exigua TaxID=749465 RepID=A0ACC2HR66_9PLEO|nr:hypothetical protein OPT61_g10172 [Boeremia exigua]
MYLPEDFMGTAHQRLLPAALDEANAENPANAPHHHAEQRFPSEQSPHGENDALATRPDSSPHVRRDSAWSCEPEQMQIDQAPHQPDEDQNLTNLLRQHLQPCAVIVPSPMRPIPESQQQQQTPSSSSIGLPSMTDKFLPQTHAYLELGSSIVRPDGQTLNTDGANGEREGRPHPAYNVKPADWGLPELERQPRILDYANQYQALQGWQPATSIRPPQPYQASFTAVSSLPSAYAQSYQPAPQERRTDSLPRRQNLQPLPDPETLRKQEIYRQKGEARRKSIAARTAGQTPTPVTASTTPLAPLTTAPLTTIPATRPLPTYEFVNYAAPPAKRRRTATRAVPELRREEESVVTYHSAYDDFWARTQPAGAPAASLPQPIVPTYEAYKWPIHHYHLHPTNGYAFAESWLDALLATTLAPHYRANHLSHITPGFIQNGTPLSLLVLHNATNPFSESHDATVSIGVYGLHWRRSADIHWTTLASDQRALFADAEAKGALVEVERWECDEARAERRRFHRAYWLAANRRKLGGLLNRAPVEGEEEDEVGGAGEVGKEEEEDGFVVEEADLSAEWGVDEGGAEVAWEKVLQDVEDEGEEGREYVVVASSEVWGSWMI